MDDLISRQAAIDAADRTDYVGLSVEDVKKVTDEVVKELKKLPSARQEIIRCKDCKHSRFFDPCFYCFEFGGEIIVPENGFCFMAKRRRQ